MTSDVQAEILAATVTPPPEALRERGLTHWLALRLAGWLGHPGSHDGADAPDYVYRGISAPKTTERDMAPSNTTLECDG